MVIVRMIGCCTMVVDVEIGALADITIADGIGAEAAAALAACDAGDAPPEKSARSEANKVARECISDSEGAARLIFKSALVADHLGVRAFAVCAIDEECFE